MTALDYPHVGTGWAFPPKWSTNADVRVGISDGEQHVQEALRIILRTGVGARVMRPTFGAGVDRFVFEARTDDVCYRLAHDVRRALTLWEPRVIVDEVTAVPAGSGEDRIDVSISYRIDRHRRPGNLVVPFYLSDAP